MFDLALDGAAARLILNRPAARNAIPVPGWQELGDAGEAAVARGARLLLLEGAGEAFCGGADLADFPAMRADEPAAARFREAMAAGIERIARLPIPTVALVRGPCFGAGVALAMACDLRLAGPGAVFAITPAKFGISYPQQDIHRLVSLVGPGQAARLLFGAQTIDASEALRIGLVEGKIGDMDAVLEALPANSARSLTVLKRGIRLAAAGVAEDADQARAFDELLASEELAGRLARLRPSR
jgi:enoyl-CoA hydratase/carnithine racemase